MADLNLRPDEIAKGEATLRQLATSHWTAHAVQAAANLMVLEKLATSPMTCEALASESGYDAAALARLLAALESLGLVEQRGSASALSALGRVFFEPTSPFYQGDVIRAIARDAARWASLEAAVRGPAQAPPPVPQASPPLDALASLASVQASSVIKHLDLSRVRKVLCIGDVDPRYALALAGRKADLAVDLVEVAVPGAAITEAATRAGLASRLRLIEGSALTCDLSAARYDLVLLPSGLPAYDLETCKALLARAYQAMAGEAPCVVHEVLLADRGASPLAASLSNLHRALSACPGGAYSGWEITDLMQSVGFIRMQIEPLVPTPCSLVLGYHP